MKKGTLSIIIAAALLISGCSSLESNDAPRANSALGAISDEAAAESAVDSLEPTAGFEPPTLQLEVNTYAPSPLVINLTVGSYTWNAGDFSASASADPIALAECSPDIAVVDISELIGKSLLLPDEGEIISAECYRDSIDSRPCEISNGEITLCSDSAYDVYSVTVEYEQGCCEYVFKTVSDNPPVLRLRAGNIYRALSRGNYEWEQTIGEETLVTTACGAAPWESRKSAPQIELSGETKAVLMLPDSAEITGIYVYSDEDIFEKPEFSSRTFDLPDDPANKVYAVNVVFPQGSCEYIFSTFIDDEICSLPPYIKPEARDITSES